MITIDLNTATNLLKKAFGSGRPNVRLSALLSNSDLKQLALQHSSQLYTNPLYALLVTHANADASLCELLLSLSNGSNEVATAIATSGRSSLSTLEQLLNSESPIVAEQAKLAIISQSIKDLNESSLSTLLKKYENDDPFSVSVRYIIAVNKATPMPILEILKNDEYDHISQAAAETLKNEK